MHCHAGRYRLVIAATLLHACTTVVSAGDRWPTVTSEPWPEADALFHRDPRWRGGDGASSVDLGGGRVLWLFGDSFVSNTPIDQRRGTRMVNNSLGIQRGYDPVSATMTCYWNSEGDQPEAFFRPEGDTWYWPASGVIIGDRLLITLMHMRRADKGMGFKFEQSAAVMVENPGASPDDWRWSQVTAPDKRFRLIYGSGGMEVDGDYLISMSPQAGKWHHAYLTRWPVADVERGDLSQPELWCDGQWRRLVEVEKLPEPTIWAAQTEFTTHFADRLQTYYQLECSYLTQNVGVRFAKSRTGPWSVLQSVFTPKGRDNVFHYAGKAHPEIQTDGVVVTYCSNGRELGQIVDDESIYYPRFLRLQFDGRD